MGFLHSVWHGIKKAWRDVKGIVHGNVWGIVDVAALFTPFGLAPFLTDAALAALEGPGPPQKLQFLTYLSAITAESYVQISSECTNVVNSVQYMEIDCQPDMTDGLYYEENSTCQYCLVNAMANAQGQWALEERMWDKGKDVKVRLSYNDQIAALIVDLESCATYCKACSFINNSQYSAVEAQSGCQLNEQTLQEWRNTVTGQIQSLLHQRQDILSAMVESLGTSTADKTVETITQNIQQELNFKTAQIIHGNINVEQSFVLRQQGSAPVIFQGNDQQNVISRTTMALMQAKFASDLMTDTQWSMFANTWIEKSTINSVGEALVKTADSFSDIIKTTIGGLMFGVMLVAAILAVTLVILIIVHVVKAKKRRQREGR